MTPKEKARNLAMKYWKLNYDWDGGTKDEWAKEGALIAVNEILEEYKEDYKDIHKDIFTIYSWWKQVKKEIETL